MTGLIVRVGGGGITRTNSRSDCYIIRSGLIVMISSDE